MKNQIQVGISPNNTLLLNNFEIPEISFTAILDFNDPNQEFNRYEFLSAIAKATHKLGWSPTDKYGLINYWYDGPIGFQALELYNDDFFHKTKNSVIAITRATNGTYELLMKIIHLLQQNNNLIVLLPSPHTETYYYQGLLLSAEVIHI